MHLDTGQDEQRDRVDVAHCAVDMAASWGINIDIGNMAWEDVKEEEEELYGALLGAPLQPIQPDLPDLPAVRWQYACWSMVPNGRSSHPLWLPLRSRLTEPQSATYPRRSSPDDFKSADQRRVQMVGNYADHADAWAQIARLHPWFCKAHPSTHRQVAICIDEVDFEDDGVAFVWFDWDGVVGAYDDVQIVALRPDCRRVKRVAASRAVAEMDEYCREQGLPLAGVE